MLKNPLKLTKSLSAQYYNIAQHISFLYVCTYVRMHVYTYVRRTYVCIYVCMYAFVSFLMIKSGVFVSALKIDWYNKNKCQKFTIKIFTIRYEKLTKLTNLTSAHHTKGHWNNKRVQNEAIKIIVSACIWSAPIKKLSATTSRSLLNLPTLQSRRQYLFHNFTHKKDAKTKLLIISLM